MQRSILNRKESSNPWAFHVASYNKVHDSRGCSIKCLSSLLATFCCVPRVMVIIELLGGRD